MTNFRHIPCGTCVNESERKAIECLKACLQCAASGPWLLLSNLNHSVSAQRRSDEIDGALQVDRIKVECKDNQQLKPRYLSRQETDEVAA